MIRTDDELTMLSYNVNQVLNTNQQNTQVKGDRIGLSSVITQFLINQAVVILGTFLLLNLYLRRRMMARMGSLNGTSTMDVMVSPTTTYGSSLLKYYCISCETQHKQVACPKCGSKMRRIG
jgi:hypothetical protein